VAVVAALIKAGAAVDRARFGGETPLYAAAKQNHEAVVAVLLEAGANVDMVTEDLGYSARFWIKVNKLEVNLDPRCADRAQANVHGAA
jgi:ankyrin repeat protein